MGRLNFVLSDFKIFSSADVCVFMRVYRLTDGIISEHKGLMEILQTLPTSVTLFVMDSATNNFDSQL